MELEILSGMPLVDANEDNIQELGNPAGLVRRTKSELVIDKQEFAYTGGTANGLQAALNLQIPAGYKRLLGFGLITRAVDPADTYNIGIDVDSQTLVDSADYRFFNISDVTPVMQRYTILNYEVRQSTIKLKIELLGAAGGGTQLTGALNGQVVYMLTKK